MQFRREVASRFEIRLLSRQFRAIVGLFAFQCVAWLPGTPGQSSPDDPVARSAVADQAEEFAADSASFPEAAPLGSCERSSWTRSDLPTLHLRGRIDTDSLWTDQSASNRVTYGNFSDVVALRRARIGIAGNLTSDIAYVGEIDLATSQAVIKDGYFDWKGLNSNKEFKVGHMREPFSLEGGTSANSFAFLERSPINLLDPARNWGLGVLHCGPEERSTLMAALFQSGTDPSDLEFGKGSTTAFTARWTELACYKGDGSHLIHFGLAISERIPNNGFVVLRQRPSSPLIELGDSSDSPFVPKIEVPAVFQQLVNLQWAAVRGPLWAQAEWYGTVICQPEDLPAFFHGSYLDVGCFLTGEHRSYLKRAGVFGQVSVGRPVVYRFSSKSQAETLGYGAWEVTGRVAYLDLANDQPNVDLGQQAGTRMPQITIGLNWYLADRLRILANYSYAVPQDVFAGSSSASVIGMRLGAFW